MDHKFGQEIIITKPPFDELKIGDWIKNNEIYDIKKGGMGIVYIAYDHKEHKPYAIKTFQDKFLNKKQPIDSFLLEVETWLKLGVHQNIVMAYSVENIANRPYIFLEVVTGNINYGSDLRGWISNKALDVDTTLSFAVQFCMGMEHAVRTFKEEGASFVHQDIKPDNIMITHDNIVKITDFGIVKAFIANETTIDFGSFKNGFVRAGKSALLKKGSICGTPQYMSPEQWIGDNKIDTQSDIYSFGCVLYEMLTCKRPFTCQHSDYEKHHRTVKPKPLNIYIDDIPIKLDNIIMKCLEKDPKERFQTFGQLKESLLAIYSHQTDNNIIEDKPGNIDHNEWNNKGCSFHNIGKREDAIICFEKSLQVAPGNIAALSNMGLCLFKIGKYKEANECYDKGLALDPEDAALWNHKGDVFAALNKFQEAVNNYDKGLKINNHDPRALGNKANALFKLGKVEGAITCFKEALEIEPNNANAWFSLGNLHYSITDFHEAIDCFDNALSLKPNFAEALKNKGTALARIGKPKEAANFFMKAIAIKPDIINEM